MQHFFDKLLGILISWAILLIMVGPIIFSLIGGAFKTSIKKQLHKKPNLVWVGNPTLSQALASKALKECGYRSQAFCFTDNQNNVSEYYDNIILTNKETLKGFKTILNQFRAYYFFCTSLIGGDIIHGFFDGGFLKQTALKDIEYTLFKIGCKALIIMPYGSDSFIYKELPNNPVYELLMERYPQSNKQQLGIFNRIARTSKTADCIIGAIGHTLTLKRVDVWPVLWYPYPRRINKTLPYRRGKYLRIVHATNHGSLKGTKALRTAVEELQSEGLLVKLNIIENVKHHKIYKFLNEADVVVDQLYVGYALGAIEAAALGKPVITSLNYPPAHSPFYENSYLQHCPFINSNIHTIKDTLRALTKNPNKLKKIGERCKNYVQKFHSETSTMELFEAIYAKIWYRESINLDTLYKHYAE